MGPRNAVAGLGIVLSLASGWVSAQTIYRLTDLGTLGGTTSSGTAINAAGQVLGNAHTSGDAGSHAFLWDGATMKDLGTLGGSYSEGTAINDSGQVTGFSVTHGDDSSLSEHAFLWDGTTMRDLGTLPGGDPGPSYGGDINASGQVAGYAYTDGDPSDPLTDSQHHLFLWDGTTMRDLGTNGLNSIGGAINDSGQVAGRTDAIDGGETFPGDLASHAFLWDGITTKDLGTLGGRFSVSSDINASGQVVGFSTNGEGNEHAFLWDGTTMRDLGTLGGTTSLAITINDSGLVTGYAYTTGDAERHPFLWDGTMMQDLGTLGGTLSVGLAINASGQVTGVAMIGDGTDHAFLWDGTALRDLNDLIDPADPLQPYVTLSEGRDINDLGQIVANGVDSRTGHTHAYLVSPVPDTTPPVITPVVTGILGGQGWYRSTVTVTWEVTDAQSAISATAGCGRAVVVSDTPGKTFTCRAWSSGGRKTKSITIKRDTTSPTIVIRAPIDGRTYHRHQKVAAAYVCTDQTSGVRDCLGTVANAASIDTASAGTKSFTVKAIDRAGNKRHITIHYRVVN